MTAKDIFRGAITALITPFHEDGSIDEQAYQDFITWQINEGVHGLVTCGTTGESPTLDHKNHNRVVELGVEAAGGKVPVMAGAGSNCTDESIALAKHAQKAGADAILIATPYYNKPCQEGIYQHFKAINNAVDVPIYIYNIPGRSVVDIADKTIARIATLENVVGIKDSTGDLARCSSLRQYVDDSFNQISGEDGTAIGFNAQGGNGVITVTANVAPKLVAQAQEFSLNGDYKSALALHDKLTPLHQAMFCAPNPTPAKFALKLMNKCNDQVRLPLVRINSDAQKQVEQALIKLGLI